MDRTSGSTHERRRRSDRAPDRRSRPLVDRRREVGLLRGRDRQRLCRSTRRFDQNQQSRPQTHLVHCVRQRQLGRQGQPHRQVQQHDREACRHLWVHLAGDHRA